MVKTTIRSLEKNNSLPEISMLKAMQMLVSAWNAVSTEAIVNCFFKAGISTPNQEAEWEWCFTKSSAEVSAVFRNR